MQKHAAPTGLLKSEAARADGLELQRFCAAAVVELAEAHRDITSCLSTAASRYWHAGKKLVELRERLAGSFQEWLENNRDALGFGRSTAYLYVAFYVQHVGRDPEDLGKFAIRSLNGKQPIDGDVALKPASTAFAGVVNRFEMEWQRWEQRGGEGRDQAREVFRPMYERLRALYQD